MMRGCLVFLLLTMGGCGVLMFIGSRTPTPPAKTVNTTATVSTKPPEPVLPSEPVNPWRKTEEEDAMGRKRQFAVTPSMNTLSFGFPYQGEQHATLMLRRSQAGSDVMVTIEKGQFLCYASDCSVNVRFDDGPPKRVSASGPTDHSTTMLFLSGAGGLIQQMKRSKLLRVEATFYQHGSQVLEFNVSGLTWP